MEAWELKQMQSLPLILKIRKTQMRIREWYEHFNGNVYVSFSGGKDSTVLLDIARGMYPLIPAVYVDTGLEYPEIKEFVKTKENVIILRPKMAFPQVIKEYGYPIISKRVAQAVQYSKPNNSYWKLLHGTSEKNGIKSIFNCKKYEYLTKAPFKVSNACCRIMKIQPIQKYQKETGCRPILGVTAAESKNREVTYLKTGCNSFQGKNATSKPLGFWLEQDILHYIKEYNLDYCNVYGELFEDDLFSNNLKFSGCQRTGCMFCMFGVQLEKYPNRFQQMAKSHPQIYKYCMEELKIKEVLDYIHVDY